MKKNKKCEELSLNVIVIAALALLILVVIALIFMGRAGMLKKNETITFYDKSDKVNDTNYTLELANYTKPTATIIYTWRCNIWSLEKTNVQVKVDVKCPINTTANCYKMETKQTDYLALCKERVGLSYAIYTDCFEKTTERNPNMRLIDEKCGVWLTDKYNLYLEKTGEFYYCGYMCEW